MPTPHLLQEKIKETFGHLSPNDKRIAEFVLNNQIQAALDTVDTLAKNIKVSKSAIVRFANRIGYPSFKSLQKELQELIYQKKMESPLDLLTKARHLGDYGKDILMEQFRKNIENIKTTLENIQISEFNKVVERLCGGSGKIFIMGQRKSYALAIYLYALLNSILDNVYVLESRESFLTDNLISIDKKDLLTIFSFKRYAMISVKVAEYFRSVGAKVVLITDSQISPTAKFANYTFICASEGVSIFDTVVPAICLIEAMISAVAVRMEKAVRGRLKISEDLLIKFLILQR